MRREDAFYVGGFLGIIGYYFVWMWLLEPQLQAETRRIGETVKT